MAGASSLSKNITGLVLCAVITVPVLMLVSKYIAQWLEAAGMAANTAAVMEAPLLVILVGLINGTIVFTLFRDKALMFRIAFTCLNCAATTLIYIAVITTFFV